MSWWTVIAVLAAYAALTALLTWHSTRVIRREFRRLHNAFDRLGDTLAGALRD